MNEAGHSKSDPIESDPAGDLLDQCRIMLRFATKEGLQLDEALRADIANLDLILVHAHLVPISNVSPKLITAAEQSNDTKQASPASPSPQVGEPIGPA
jgi:hypothetical protein